MNHRYHRAGESSVKHFTGLPHMGQRILKTATAVFLCLVIYILRDYRGMVSQSTIAAIICLQPFRADGRSVSINRIIGTLIGAVWGLLFLLLMQVVPVLSHNMLTVYFVMAVGVAVSLYCSVALKKQSAAGLAAIVFLCIVLGYPDLEQPLTQTVNRVVDTVIGIAVAAVVDNIHLPRQYHREYIFFIRLQDLVEDRFSTVASAVLVMLNRLVSEGANICLVSKWAPAFLISQMGQVQLHLPVIVMDGAAIYDMESGSYMDIASLSQERVAWLGSRLEELNVGYQIYAVRNRTMEIYRRGHMNWAEEREYQLMRSSPYRNYLDGDYSEADQIIFVRFIDSDIHMDLLEAQIRRMVPQDTFRIVRRKQPKLEGYSGLYFYAPEATVENRQETLMKLAAERSGCDVSGLRPMEVRPKWSNYVPERDAMSFLSRVRGVYAPVKLWRKR